jgi:hypothetical protein
MSVARASPQRVGETSLRLSGLRSPPTDVDNHAFVGWRNPTRSSAPPFRAEKDQRDTMSLPVLNHSWKNKLANRPGTLKVLQPAEGC